MHKWVIIIRHVSLIMAKHKLACTTMMYRDDVQVALKRPVHTYNPLILLTLLGIGGARRDRTVDLYAASVALSQLSYGPITYNNISPQAARI